MGNVRRITVEVRPTVTLESAVACVMMLNMFLQDNEDYDLQCVNRGDGFKWELTDDVKPRLQTAKPSNAIELTDEEKELLESMPALRKLAAIAGLEAE